MTPEHDTINGSESNVNQDASAKPPEPKPDTTSYFERILAYIPGTINAAYVAAIGLLHEAGNNPAWLHWAVFLSLWALVPFYAVYLNGKSPATKMNARFHALTASIAFAVWAYAIDGSPVAVSFPEFYRPLYGSLLLIVATLVLPVLEKLAEKLSFFRKEE